ncbi:iron-sulfur protein [Clostridium gelidum]|uniref:Iron-sulfur protein n=1 Tax=Clostridium gelidum TaxID=704125 RepID=A0ABM7TA25_9CLOT|nr:EFR1 family ferrodoxin [Clostridium gelidum]BCZ45800.1 iron-sulfur protein [Clostridium gelidum]
METTIYVFSGTGTALAVASKIASELVGEVEIKSIAKELIEKKENEIKVESSKVGFIFPCYYGEMPTIVTSFVRKLNLDNTNYIFSVVTAGGNIGYSLEFLKRELENKGKKLNYGKSMIVSSNYIVAWYYNLIVSKGEKLKQSLKDQENKSIQIAVDVKGEKEEIEKSSYLLYKMPHILTSSKIVEDTRPWDKEFSANEKCNGCSICIKVCSVKNIVMKNNKPEFQHNCQRCMACIQYCPNQAIMFKGKLLDKPRYFHPDITHKEMIKFVQENKN